MGCCSVTIAQYPELVWQYSIQARLLSTPNLLTHHGDFTQTGGCKETNTYLCFKTALVRVSCNELLKPRQAETFGEEDSTPKEGRAVEGN